MSRVLRAFTSTTALAVAAALIPATAGVATAATGTITPTAERSSAPVSVTAPAGVELGETSVHSTDFVDVEATPSARTSGSARATTWPVGGGRVDLVNHTGTATGTLAQQLSSAKLRFYRARGGVIEGSVRLRGTPTAETPSVVVLAFGRKTSAGGCSSPAGANIRFRSTRQGSETNPVYRGSAISVRPFRAPAAATASWNCAFAQTRSGTTAGATIYDELAGNVSLFRQKPILTIRVAERTISSQSFTTVPVTIANSSSTVATAYNTRLGVTAKGLSYRFDPAVGSIRPGDSRKGSIKLKYTSRYSGYFIITVRSGDYVKKVKYTVTPVR